MIVEIWSLSREETVGPPVGRRLGRHARDAVVLISLSPSPCLQLRVVCSGGTWMAPSDVHVQTAGAWKESEMARDPGGPL
jgi:hypothetical protein